MALVVQVVVESRRYSGWIDPRYPIGYWQAQLFATGDVTGGTLALDLVFQPGTEPHLNSQMYSLERFSIQAAENAARVARLIAVNMGGVQSQSFGSEYSVALEVQSGPLQAAVAGNQLTFLPWFLGSQRNVGITASLSVLLLNRDGITFKFGAEGYRWSPRSVLVDGGPQRPPTGLYAR